MLKYLVKSEICSNFAAVFENVLKVYFIYD